MKLPQRRSGFTLLELMIVVVVVAVLAAIALPTYNNAQRRAARSAAESLMLDLANRQAQALLDQRVYVPDSTGAGVLGYSPYPAEVTDNYTVTIATTAGPPPTFTISAAPKTGTLMAGDGTLTINQAGTKAPADKWGGR